MTIAKRLHIIEAQSLVIDLLFMTNPNIEEDTAIVKLVDRIIAKAIEDRATHLYFEPQAQSLQIRVRQDGLLQVALQNFPAQMVAPTIDYLKLIAKIDIYQTGTILVK
jgi:type II secretory ATPase GspE/PulE/Tfp pilus assembly ATPase PilB-like protein